MAQIKLLTEDTNRKYDIAKEDIYAYAQRLGIDINKEKHLIWIAEKGLSANVPKPWLILADKKDRIFYYNPKTHEKSWYHPLDKVYEALVSEERTKSKSLNSASSDYGFESKLSSLADAPPLSSSGKNSPLPLNRAKTDGGLSGKKLEFGRIENRRGAQLAPVRLNTLKMPATITPKSSGGMSFMPKGSTLTRSLRRTKEEIDYDNQLERPDYEHPHPDDSNESLNSDEGSKYSYEETDEEDEKHIHGLEPYDMLDTSQLSPMHSADESPDALDINSLVQLGTKLPPRLDSSLKREQLESVINKENSPSLNLRKVGQPSFLKPLTQITKKKATNKGSKAPKKVKNKYSNDNEMYFDDKESSINVEQQVMLEQIQKEWLMMQDELEKQEKEKYEEMIKSSSKKLEEEEMKLRDENSERLAKIKNELQKKIEEEESAAEKSLHTLKASNNEKYSEVEKKLQKELETLSESLKADIEKMKEKNASELAQQKRDLEEAFKKEIDNLRIIHDSNKKDLEEAHANEISHLQEAYKREIEDIKSSHEKEIHEVKNKISDSLPEKSELQEEIKKLEVSIKEENEKYQNLLKEKENVLKEIGSENENLEKLKNETSETQTAVEELQDEVEKIENELDLLRSEKSGLFSELNILKENINNEKSNLSNLEKKLNSSFEGAGCSKEFFEVGVNTDSTFIDTMCKDVQVSVSYCDVSSQIENIKIPMLNAICQTTLLQIDTKSCQTDPVPSINNKNIAEIDSDGSNLNSNFNKSIENVLSGLDVKLDSRINVIEQQLRLLQNSLSRSSASQPVYSSQEFVQNQFAEVKNVPNSESKTIPPVYFTDSSVPVGLFSSNVPTSSQNKCKCEFGDSAACDVLQDVKNSVYRLNDILCASFVPPLRSGNVVYPVNQTVNSYSSPFDNFYAQFRQMQEKHRLTELKHKCENEAVKLTKSISSNSADARTFKGFNDNDSKLPYHLIHSDVYSYNASEDPFIRARSIVLREQAKAWKEQQSLNTSLPQIFSMNSSSECSHSSVTEFVSPHNVPSSQQTFLNFEVDPETDYNLWMTRLNALQLRIRSHKML